MVIEEQTPCLLGYRRTDKDSIICYLLYFQVLNFPSIQKVASSGEIGDVTRFPTPSKLLAFSGLNPAVHQSGNFNFSHKKMSKRGFGPLRYALVNAAHNAVRNNQTFHLYYDKKMSKGRTQHNALEHCAGKLVRIIIYKMLTDKVPFNLE